MDKNLVKNEIKKLREEIEYHNKLYYDENRNLISDYEYDKKMSDLINLEIKYPEYKSPSSPTVKVGGKITKEFDTYKHSNQMLSLSNTYTNQDLEEYDKRIKKNLNIKNVEYSCELKYDGVALSILYENGKFKRALTRGDGSYGDDVSNNAITIRTLPIKLNENNFTNIEVRGEAFISKSDFNKLNERKKDRNEQLFSNPRNTASGSLKLQDSSLVARRKINCFIYSLNTYVDNIETQEESLQFLKKIGFNVPNTFKKCVNINEVKEYINYWESRRHDLDVETDGIVIKINNLEYQKKLGNTSKSPRWAIAYKYKAENKETKVKDIQFQVGRTGAITPVAILEAVHIGGSIVRRASLHNANEIERLNIRIGDYVNIEKGGEIIPKITSVVIEKREPKSTKFNYIKYCPHCKSELIIEKNQAIHYCKNDTLCIPQVSGKIEHFISKNAMDIENLGPETIKGLINKNIINNPYDLYRIEYNDIINLEFNLNEKEKTRSLKRKSCENILNSIEKSKKKPFSNILFALGIRYVGKTTAEKLTAHFKDIDRLMEASFDMIIQVDEIGDKIAASIIKYFSLEVNKKLINNLKSIGLNLIEKNNDTQKSNKLSELNFVISGKFLKFSRDSLQIEIKNNGGKVSKSLSSKTHFLIAGENMGPKKKIKAEELEIKIINEDDFISML